MTDQTHDYAVQTTWHGPRREEPWAYRTYSRDFVVSIEGKPELGGSATPIFVGDPEKHNPEDLFLAALSSCHMLSYLALCARGGVEVVGYVDRARGTLALSPDGGGRFVAVEIRPEVTIREAAEVARAHALHQRAHELCFIANSCSAPIRVTPRVKSLERER